MKRNLIILAVPVTLAVGAVGLIAARAATPAPPSNPTTNEQSGANDQQPSYKSSVTIDENNDSDAALAAKAKISAKDAESKALAKYPGGSVVGAAQLEDENGNVVFGVEIKAADGKTYDVKVDAGNGTVLSSEAGGADAGETAGAESEK